jgi:hypothetical protein
MKRLVFVAIIITQIAISCKKDSQDDCKSHYYYYSSDKISLTDVSGTGNRAAAGQTSLTQRSWKHQSRKDQMSSICRVFVVGKLP